MAKSCLHQIEWKKNNIDLGFYWPGYPPNINTILSGKSNCGR